MILAVIALIQFIGTPLPVAGMAMAVLIGLVVLRTIYIIPPAIILYIDSRLK